MPRAVTSRYAWGDLVTPAGPVPLTVVTGDQSAVPFAFGPLDPAIAYVNLGTGAFVQRAVSGQLPDAPRLLVSVVWSDSGARGLSAGGHRQWRRQRAGLAGSAGRRHRSPNCLGWRRRPGRAASAPPLFINGVSGLGAPFWVSSFESRFIGTGDVSARLAAVLESIVFLVNNNLDELRPHGPPLDRIIVTGGMAENDFFCRALAALARIPVFRSREREATAKGLAYLVAGQPAGWPAQGEGDTFAPAQDTALAGRFSAWLVALRSAIAANAGGPNTQKGTA